MPWSTESSAMVYRVFCHGLQNLLPYSWWERPILPSYGYIIQMTMVFQKKNIPFVDFFYSVSKMIVWFYFWDPSLETFKSRLDALGTHHAALWTQEGRDPQALNLPPLFLTHLLRDASGWWAQKSHLALAEQGHRDANPSPCTDSLSIRWQERPLLLNKVLLPGVLQQGNTKNLPTNKAAEWNHAAKLHLNLIYFLIIILLNKLL